MFRSSMNSSVPGVGFDGQKRCGADQCRKRRDGVDAAPRSDSSGCSASTAAASTRHAEHADERQLGRGDHGASPRLRCSARQLDAVEALANAEQEQADHDERDQHRERDADFDDQRHAARAGCREDQAVFQRHEADHLADRVAPRHHHQQAQQDHGQREREVLAAQRIDACGDLQHQHDRQRDEADADQHRHPDADRSFDFAVNVEPPHDAPQRRRNQYGFERRAR